MRWFIGLRGQPVRSFYVAYGYLATSNGVSKVAHAISADIEFYRKIFSSNNNAGDP